MQKLSRILSSYVSIGNSMICSDIWHKNYELYFKIFCTFFVRVKCETILKYMPNITYKLCCYLFILLPANSL